MQPSSPKPSAWTIQQSSLKFGILLAKSGTTVLPPCIIGECCLCLTNLTLDVYIVSFLHRGAQAAIVVYDITNQDTFGRDKVWVKELQRQASPNIVIALAGNKADLAAKRAVEFEEAKGYAEENGLLFMETSAKTAMNVNDIFLAIGIFIHSL